MGAGRELGVFVERDGVPAVRVERVVEADVARVWRALTEPSELAAWFPSPTVRLEPVAGGRIDFSGDPYADPEAEAEAEASSGMVLAYEEPRLLAYTWGEDELHFELSPGTRSEGPACVLALTDVLETHESAARNAAGWDVCLDELVKLVEGGTPSGPHSEGATDWRTRYDAYVAAGTPSGAPVPEV
ncbi:MULTISPECIES: SRPBCC domain-containing protein [unclassified Streptomyces]|uniref:SRPBCC domain-containing protein n=1 Tax=unclassified Streptomyces TaxID=2593676 RepID=UPI002DD8AFB0|nr:SRPBCC domain-containing protein [Streptomyces sp. NBC_01775]WSB76113.1 SRPBCC domain-containing protein [Streptomyces sp. NBC_01775]WSS44454.1 SRPBCC domain-containing protein [Streptomyces sp. NBC_01187]